MESSPSAPRERLQGKGGHPFAVLGGGIVGLCAARELARGGRRVVLIEKSRIGAGASGASAGLLERPAGTRSEFHRRLAAAYDAYPAFIQDLERETGLSIEFSRPGMLDLAADPDGEGALRKQLADLESRGIPARWVDPRELRELVPGIAPDLAGGLFYPETARVHPPDLLRALRASLESLRVPIREGFRTVDLARCAPGGAAPFEIVLEDARGSLERLRGWRVIACLGAWTAGVLAGAGVSLEAPIVPVRGQMIELRAPAVPSCLLTVGETYIIPRPEGTLWAGATVEDAGFSAEATEDGIAGLLEDVRRAFPAIERRDVARAWAGLRPKVLRRGGALIQKGGLWVIAGHYRSGILAGPRDAALAVEEILAG